MKNQAEIYQALLDGKTINSSGIKVKLINGCSYSLHPITGKWELDTYGFYKPRDWEIEQQWHEKDISNGVLCRVRQRSEDCWKVDVICGRDEDGDLAGKEKSWIFVEPLDLTKPLLPQLEDK